LKYSFKCFININCQEYLKTSFKPGVCDIEVSLNLTCTMSFLNENQLTGGLRPKRLLENRAYDLWILLVEFRTNFNTALPKAIYGIKHSNMFF